jgi:hypothetical protein
MTMIYDDDRFASAGSGFLLVLLLLGTHIDDFMNYDLITHSSGILSLCFPCVFFRNGYS